jgi:hypothetical protein
MKKLPTTMMQRTLNEQDGRQTIGLDLGDRSSFYCVQDEAGDVLLEQAGDVLLEQKVSTTPKAKQEIFGAIPRSRTALETGTHSPWVSRLLKELGPEPIVAHARSVRLTGESRAFWRDEFSAHSPSMSFSTTHACYQQLRIVVANRPTSCELENLTCSAATGRKSCVWSPTTG